MFCDEGHLIHTFFDDPRTEIWSTMFDRPLGAGQGFVERPWIFKNTNPVYGPAELVSFNIFQFDLRSLVGRYLYNVFPRDSWGDRVVDIEVLEPGIFPLGTQATVQWT